MIYIYSCGDFCQILSLVLHEALTANGIECQLSRNISQHLDSVWILFCYHHDMITSYPKNYIAYQTEPALECYDMTSTYIQFLKGARQVWEYSRTNLPFYSSIQNGVVVHPNVVYMPFRYATCLETWNQPQSLETKLRRKRRDFKEEKYQKPDESESIYDVCFIGHLTNYRLEILNHLKAEGVNVGIITGVFGQDRERILERSKIHLILQNNERYAVYPQDISRIFPFGAKRYFMISEPIGECPIGSLVQCPIDQLVPTIRFLLQSSEYRKQNVEAVYQDISAMTMSAEILKNLDLIWSAIHGWELEDPHQNQLQTASIPEVIEN